VIHVIATVDLHPDTRERFLHEFSQVAPQVRAEQGCIEYGAAVDVATGMAVQIPVRSDTVTVVEKWSSVEALQAHVVTPHMRAFFERTQGFVVHLTIQVLEPKA